MIFYVHNSSFTNLFLFLNSRRKSLLSQYSGVFNAFYEKKEQVLLYSKFAGTTSSRFHVASYAGLPSIVSNDCNGEGKFVGIDGDRVCKYCK